MASSCTRVVKPGKCIVSHVNQPQVLWGWYCTRLILLLTQVHHILFPSFLLPTQTMSQSRQLFLLLRVIPPNHVWMQVSGCNVKGKVLGGLQVSSKVGGGSFFATALVVLCRSSLWCSLYLCWPWATSQLFSMFTAVFFHKGDHSHFASFYIGLDYGAVCQTATFNANLICSAGRDCTTFDHRLAPSGIAALICPSCSRLFSSVSFLASSALLGSSIGSRHQWLLVSVWIFCQDISDHHRGFVLLPRECEVML